MTNSKKGLAFPGMHKVWSKGNLYIYPWRKAKGGERPPCIYVIKGKASKNDALAELANPDKAAHVAGLLSQCRSIIPQQGYIEALVMDYKRNKLPLMAQSTQKLYRPHLDSISSKFGTTSLDQIQRKGARKLIKLWHSQMKDKPTKADRALTTLVGLFNYAIDQEMMTRNPASGLPRFTQIGQRAHITWSADLIAQAMSLLNEKQLQAFRLSYLTGMRPQDVVDLNWSEVLWDKGYIRRKTKKSIRRNSERRPEYQRIPLTSELNDLLNSCPEISTKVITSSKGLPYASASSLSSSIMNTLRRHGLASDVVYYDLRGTRATLHFLDGCSDEQAERYMGWAPGQGPKMRAYYVNADMLSELESGFTLPKFSIVK